MQIMRRRNLVNGSATQPSVGGSFDIFAELPGPRLQETKDWATDIPNWGAIPAERRVTVASSTEAALQSAIDTAAALTGGHRLVIVPDAFSARCHIVLPANADPSYDIIIAWADVVDGTYPLTRWSMIPKTAPANMPLLETKMVPGHGEGEQDSIIYATQAANRTRFKLFGLNIRIASATTKDIYCPALVEWGDYGGRTGGTPSTNEATIPSFFLLSHCIFGGRKFDAAGEWRTGNLGRGIQDHGKNVAILDSWNVEHGSGGGPFSSGSDRGIWHSYFGTGGFWAKNCATDFGGGITYYTGGVDVNKTPEEYRTPDDCLVEYCWVERDQVYNRFNASARLADSASAYCQWIQKNQFETKVGKRIRAYRNVFLGHYVDGQDHAINLKSETLGGKPQSRTCYDISFSENIIVSGAGSINLPLITNSYPPFDAMQRLTVRGNIVITNSSTLYPSASTPNGRGIQLSWAYSDGVYGGPIAIVNNFVHSVNAQGNGIEVLGAKTNRRTELQIARNLVSDFFYPANNTDENGSFSPGLNAIGGTWGTGGIKTFDDNAWANGTGSAPGSDSDFSAEQFYGTNLAAFGITATGTPGKWTRSGGSSLIGAAAGGVDIGPDFAGLSAIYDAIYAEAF